jgi:hypothetical protein
VTDYTLTATVREGKLEISDKAKAEMRQALAAWKDGPVIVEVSRRVARRSAEQNAYWWAVCVDRVHQKLKDQGWTPEDVHDYAKAICLDKADAARGINGKLLGEDYVIGGSTAKLNKLEFSEFVERWRQHAAEKFSVEIPDPNPAWREVE